MRTVFDPTSAGHLCRIAASAVLLAALAACGYKGPLYMPKPAPPPESLTKPPTPQPLPAEGASPSSTGQDAATPSAVK
jgi:predicted small lipoprotein YifL